MVFGGIVLGVGLILIVAVAHLWQFYLLFGVVSGIANMAVGPNLVTPTIIAKWFIRRRGRALALAAVGNNVGGLVLIPLAAFIILHFGWREAWVVIGVLTILSIVPLSALFIRRMPEDVGLLPDGDAHKQSADVSEVEVTQASLSTEYDWTLGEALRTPALWLIIAAHTIGGVGLSGLPMHLIPALTDKGYSSTYAATLITVFSFIVIASKLSLIHI